MGPRGGADGAHAAVDRDLTVAIAVSAAAWEARIVAEFDDRSEGVVVVRRCVDVADLLATAGAGLARAVLVSPELRQFDREAVAQLLAAGVAVVGVIDPSDRDRSSGLLRDLGLFATVEADAGATVISEALRLTVRAPVDHPRTAYSHGPLDPVDPARPAGFATPRPPPIHRPGQVVAMWGPTGAPGRSTLAMTLADEAARLGVPVLLIDADVYGGVVGAMLGLLEEAPGLAAACRQAGTTRLDAAGLARLCLTVRPNFRVLTGISRVDRWPEIRAGSLEVVLDAARTLVPLTVIDCGFSIEQDEEITFDTAAPRRNGATFVALERADHLICVTGGDPIGIQRAVRALLDLREVLPEVAPRVLVNRLRSAVIGGEARVEIAAAYQRFASSAVDWFIPDDGKALDAAMSQGRTLAEAAPGSPVRVAVRALAAELTGAEISSKRRRRR